MQIRGVHTKHGLMLGCFMLDPVGGMINSEIAAWKTAFQHYEPEWEYIAHYSRYITISFKRVKYYFTNIL